MQCMPPLDLSPPEREPTMESGGIVPPSLPPSSLLSTLQCNARNPLLQRLKCRENGPTHQPVVPPIVHSRPLLPVTDLNHQIQAPAFLFLTPHLSTELYLSATLSLISKCPTKSDWNDLPNPHLWYKHIVCFQHWRRTSSKVTKYQEFTYSVNIARIGNAVWYWRSETFSTYTVCNCFFLYSESCMSLMELNFHLLPISIAVFIL